MNLTPDIFIQIRFKTPAEGGRQTAITIPEQANYHYGCLLFVDGEGFDCRFLVKGITLVLGQTYELPVKFLWPDLALPKMLQEKSVTLWEGVEIAVGRVLRIT
jgi:hypothetical protein